MPPPMDRDGQSEASLGSVHPTDLVAQVQAANQRGSLLNKLERAANILRYYRKSQLLRRAVSIALPQLGNRKIAALPSGEALDVRERSLAKLNRLLATQTAITPAVAEQLQQDLSAGKFTLLNQCQELGTPVDWDGSKHPHPSRLWSFQLHYHEYLLDVVGGQSDISDEARVLIWKLIDDWITGNQPQDSSLTGNAWHPYCISRRLPVWAQLFAACPPPDHLRKSFLHSFASQAETLSRHLEFDLGGNHLLENLRALVFAGTLLDSPRSEGWLKLAEQQLRIELPRQVLSHGEHYERSPMYHCQVLSNLLQIMHLAAGVRDSLVTACHEYARNMYDFLQFLLHPDGEIPLLGDSCFGEAPAVAQIHRLAELNGIAPGELSKTSVTVVDRYWKWQHQRDTLLFDAGAVGADELPAHAHCDLLGFEASIDGQRWLVDSGLFDYGDGPMRAYCRSSAAHNVVTVGAKNQCDIWSRFRMGRRGRPQAFDFGEQNEFSWCFASHDGYRHDGLAELSRLFLAHQEGTLVCVEHASSPAAATSLVGRLHFAPEVRAELESSARVVLNVGDSERWLFFSPGVKLEFVEGWYCDRFGNRTRTQVLEYSLESSDHDRQSFGWSLSPSPDTQVSLSPDATADCQIELSLGSTNRVFTAPFLK